MTLYGEELVDLHTTPSMFVNFLVYAWGVEVWTNNMFYWFIEGQTRYIIQRDAKMSLALMNWK